MIINSDNDGNAYNHITENNAMLSRYLDSDCTRCEATYVAPITDIPMDKSPSDVLPVTIAPITTIYPVPSQKKIKNPYLTMMAMHGYHY